MAASTESDPRTLRVRTLVYWGLLYGSLYIPDGVSKEAVEKVMVEDPNVSAVVELFILTRHESSTPQTKRSFPNPTRDGDGTSGTLSASRNSVESTVALPIGAQIKYGAWYQTSGAVSDDELFTAPNVRRTFASIADLQTGGHTFDLPLIGEKLDVMAVHNKPGRAEIGGLARKILNPFGPKLAGA